jgi:Cys-tRNA(Pro)/Cys-tRNA(Cys) deacylase
MPIPSTPVTRALEAAAVPYRVLLQRAPALTVESAASARGVAPREMVKSLLLREKKGAGRFVLACLPGDRQLDLKAVRASLGEGWRRLCFASDAELFEQTGLRRGAVAPVALRTDLPILFDPSIATRALVNISSGDPSAGVELDARALITLTGARLAPIIKR